MIFSSEGTPLREPPPTEVIRAKQNLNDITTYCLGSHVYYTIGMTMASEIHHKQWTIHHLINNALHELVCLRYIACDTIKNT